MQQLFTQLVQRYSSQCAELTDYRLQFNSSQRQLGACNYHRRIIKISKTILQKNPLAVQEDTLKHEIAHALAFHLHGDRGHGANWQQWAIQLGAKPQARYLESLEVDYKYKIVLFQDGKLKPLDGGYHKKVSLKNRHLRGQPETVNCLYLISSEQLSAFLQGQLDFNQLVLIQ
ncbi:SprT-like domain-containing protein [Gayadomonas joobiniege]|uniref:SprT-like domain-containing protein n=1 Tax=Gayadomonas joobiniege TaxID=1234606 RepID=UPI00036A34BA|nr:SprT-like domain-containing protein [Gayadomonas joobiniege]